MIAENSDSGRYTADINRESTDLGYNEATRCLNWIVLKILFDGNKIKSFVKREILPNLARFFFYMQPISSNNVLLKSKAY